MTVPPPEPHGSLGEEAARLAGVVQEWLQRVNKPEVRAHLSDAVASVSAALQELSAETKKRRDADGADGP